jgi:hypothetical protein
MLSAPPVRATPMRPNLKSACCRLFAALNSVLQCKGSIAGLI